MSCYYTADDGVDVENTAFNMSEQPQFPAPPFQQQDFELFPPTAYNAAYSPYSPSYTPDYSFSPALTNTLSFSASSYQSFDGDLFVPAPLGLGTTALSFSSPISSTSSPVPLTRSLQSPTPLHQVPPPASIPTNGRSDRSCKCFRCNRIFTRPADLKRHNTSVHDPRYIDCPVPECWRKGSSGFPRRDHLTEHLRSLHDWEIPKRAFTARSKRVVKRRKCDD